MLAPSVLFLCHDPATAAHFAKTWEIARAVLKTALGRPAFMGDRYIFAKAEL
jgi:hypothetical protein